MQAFGEDGGQRVPPLGGGGDVLPKLRCVGAGGVLPEVGCGLLRQKLGNGLLLRGEGDVLLLYGLETGGGRLKSLPRVGKGGFGGNNLLFVVFLLGLQQGGGFLRGGGVGFVGQVEGLAFGVQTALLRFVLAQGLLRVGKLLLF